MKPLLITSGEPAGIGPDLCLALAGHGLPLVILADKTLLQLRAKQLGINVVVNDYHPNVLPSRAANHITVLSLPCPETPIAGHLNERNSSYVINMLKTAIDRCLAGEFSALVTAPVHKGIINQAGISFTGHTEFLATRCKIDTVVMLLASEKMRVALVTTHLPLKDVSAAITKSLLTNILKTLNQSFQTDFAINEPTFYVAGLNPHAGENGYLGREEIDVIHPVLELLRQQGVDVRGPFPADTMFTAKNVQTCSAFVAMYHDQGLAVLKYADFEQAVNITLGLPIIRTSVDHGTALELAGTGLAKPSSLLAAVDMAAKMVINRGHYQ